MLTLFNINKINFIKKFKDRELLMSAGWFALGKLIPGGINFLSVIFFVRFFGSELYGIFSLEMSFIFSVCTFSTGWLNQAQLRRFEFNDRSSQISTLLYCVIISIILGLFIGIFYNLFYTSNTTHSSSFTSLFIIISIILYNSIYYDFIANFKAKSASFYEIIRSIAYISIPLILGIFFKSLSALLIGVMISYLIVSSHGYFHFRKLISVKKINITLAKNIFKFGWPFSLLLFLNEFSKYIEKNTLLLNIGPTNLGQYIALSEIILRSYSLLFVPFTLAIHPKYMHFHDLGDTINAKKTLNTGIKIQFYIFMVLISVLYFVGSPILTLLLKSKDPIPTSLILILALAGFVWQQASLWQKPLEANKKSFSMLLLYFIGFCIQILILKWGTPQLGNYSAPIALLSSGIIYILLIKIYIKYIK